MKVSCVNIRATALKEFWGDAYSESLYLWEGSKHNSALVEIAMNPIPTHKDFFSTQTEIQNAHDFCKDFYYKILAELAVRLNKVHSLDHSVSFWQLVFGYWLYRHICVVYGKYVCLASLDIDNTSIKLLDQRDYYIPQNHLDYLICFSGDFGVQQLVSEYYRLYKSKHFESVTKTFNCDNLPSHGYPMLWGKKITRKLSLMKNDPEIALLNVFFSDENRNFLVSKSGGRIADITLPVIKKNARRADFAKRESIAKGVMENTFEGFFMQSLYYCFPKDFVENFTDYYSAFKKDVQSRKFSIIVGENWISDIPSAIYLALSRENKRTFIANEHGAGVAYYRNCMQFIDLDVADNFLSVGWGESKDNFIRGGFACRNINPYQSGINEKAILYIGRTKFLYGVEFNEFAATNSFTIKELQMASNFIMRLPPILRENFIFRPRMAPNYWSVESVLDLKGCNVRIDRGNFTTSILKSKIVVIDHMSTGFAEILLMKVPFVLLCDVRAIPLSDEMRLIFDDLTRCSVVHTSAQTAVSHLSSIYENVDEWWQSEPVRNSVNKLTEISVAPADRSTNYLLSLLSGNHGYFRTLLRIVRMRVLGGVILLLRVMKKIFFSRIGK